MVSMQDQARTQPGHIRSGMGGWTYAPWRNNFYPAGLVQRRELEYASRQVTAIEINGTYYKAQSRETYEKWAAETPAGFVFSVKAPRSIVQTKTLGHAGEQIERFVEGIVSLGDRLGPILWQLLPTRVFDPEAIGAFLDLLPAKVGQLSLRHAVEVRHESFRCEAYLALARKHGVATVFTDSPNYPSFADLTGDFVYARLMRSRAGEETGYPAHELATWARRADEWAKGGDPADLPHAGKPGQKHAGRDVFLYFISAAKERNPAAAIALLQLPGMSKAS
ncbi:uncharacterized protein YecE (DUF72 family) [Luteibacter rhizovicinus]|uniref:Uncharacterized protein YecE (DUF72 family) n=1 Tax=Luteibacter rhizovicinus TaxID=242606 RepID=A0A4R3YKN0_9GAMM|nr:DUF72 domain-containing protein [Luteibacter rhizovicinus]TCV92751.1 uncharacterized protein YecE (DUF72 family) [Luteibacter rhizovicinus]